MTSIPPRPRTAVEAANRIYPAATKHGETQRRAFLAGWWQAEAAAGPPASAELLERLAAIEHEQWTTWSKEVAPDIRDQKRVTRWSGYWKPYDQLDEATKEHDRVWARKVLAALPASAERVTLERAALVAEEHAERLKHTSHRDGLGMGWLAGEDLCREIVQRIRALPEAAVQEPDYDPDNGPTTVQIADSEASLKAAGVAAPVEAEGLDVELAEFFHGEYWDNTNEPHYSREQAKSGDCAICWGSADRLVRLLEQREGK